MSCWKVIGNDLHTASCCKCVDGFVPQLLLASLAPYTASCINQLRPLSTSSFGAIAAILPERDVEEGHSHVRNSVTVRSRLFSCSAATTTHCMGSVATALLRVPSTDLILAHQWSGAAHVHRERPKRCYPRPAHLLEHCSKSWLLPSRQRAARSSCANNAFDGAGVHGVQTNSSSVMDAHRAFPKRQVPCSSRADSNVPLVVHLANVLGRVFVVHCLCEIDDLPWYARLRNPSCGVLPSDLIWKCVITHAAVWRTSHGVSLWSMSSWIACTSSVGDLSVRHCFTDSWLARSDAARSTVSCF